MSIARQIVGDALVWDQLFPATGFCGTLAAQASKLDQMMRAGYDAVSITIAYDPEDTMTAIVSMTLTTMAQDAARWPADQGCRTGDLPACGPDCLEGVTERLLRAGYSPYDCRGILGENRLRLARQVWKVPTVA